MAKFVQQEGEVVLLHKMVTCVRDNKRIPGGRLLITDRRIVLLTPRKDAISRIAGIVFGRIGERMAEAVEQTHQITRADFAELEEADQKLLVFRSTVEGYEQVSFS
ncbi:MAG: hypothetical protein HOV81_10430, partial [Kofleriaceae bacterium]|nr:hypothetical protein [Kofleriaceae bacterium]